LLTNRSAAAPDYITLAITCQRAQVRWLVSTQFYGLSFCPVSSNKNTMFNNVMAHDRINKSVGD